MTSEDQHQQRPAAADAGGGSGRFGPPYTRLERVLVGLVVTFMVLGLVMLCSLQYLPKPYRVVYKVTSTEPAAFVSYSSPGGGAKFTVVSTPWELSFVAGSTTNMYLSARGTSREALATCEIWVNDRLWRTETVKGRVGSAGCNGRLGDD